MIDRFMKYVIMICLFSLISLVDLPIIFEYFCILITVVVLVKLLNLICLLFEIASKFCSNVQWLPQNYATIVL